MQQYSTSGSDRFEVSDLQGMQPAEMELARVEFIGRAQELHERPDGSIRDKSEAEQREFRHCLQLVEAIDAHVRWDEQVRGTMRNHPRSVQRAADRNLFGDLSDRMRRDGTGRRYSGAPDYMRHVEPGIDLAQVFRLGDPEVRDHALAMLESRGTDLGLRGDQMDQADQLLRATLSAENPNLDGGYIAKRTLITESPAYRSAFRQLMTETHPLLTGEEIEAVRAFRALEASEIRAMSEGSTTGGGFGIPVFIDPSIILTSGASAAPILDVCKRATVTTNQWKGVTSASVSWSWDAEGSAVSDDSPTLGQPIVPVYMMRGFLPYSIELGQDYPGFAEEMAALLAAGSLDLLASATAAGSGTNQPRGVVTALEATTASRVKVTTSGTLGAVDVFKAWNSLKERFRSQPTTGWGMSVSVESQIRSFSSANQSSAYFTVNLLDSGITELNGKAVTRSDYFPTFTGTTGTAQYAVAGAWDSYLVAMRAGMSIEAVPLLFDTTTGRPNGSRGFFAWMRAGADCVNPAGMVILDQT